MSSTSSFRPLLLFWVRGQIEELLPKQASWAPHFATENIRSNQSLSLSLGVPMQPTKYETSESQNTPQNTPKILVRNQDKTKYEKASPVLDAAFLLTVGSFLLTVELFLLTVDHFSFFAYSWSFFAYSFSFLTYSWSFCAYSGKVRLVRALRDCKQRSLTVSKKAPTVSKKASPILKLPIFI